MEDNTLARAQSLNFPRLYPFLSLRTQQELCPGPWGKAFNDSIKTVRLICKKGQYAGKKFPPEVDAHVAVEGVDLKPGKDWGKDLVAS